MNNEIDLNNKEDLEALIKKVVPKPMSKAAFNRMPQWKRRVMIAEDALALLRSSLIVSVSERECYVSNYYASITSYSATSLEGQCQLFSGGNCHVCAKGALFVSTVMRTNKMKVVDLFHGRTENKVVDEEKVFDKNTFNLIESAFEMDQHYFSDEIGDDEDKVDVYDKFCYIADRGNKEPRGNFPKKWYDAAILCYKAVKFGERHEDSTERLAAILINLIRNKGEFIPTKIVSKKDIRKALATK